MLEPCITLAVIADTLETLPRYRVQCEWPLKKLTSQLYTTSGMCRCAILSSRVEWRTVSNALLKSIYWYYNNIRIFDKLVFNSIKERDYCCCWGSSWPEGILIGKFIGRPSWVGNSWVEKLCDDQAFHDSMVSTGVIDICRKSVVTFGWVTFGTGLMYACFHCNRTVDVAMDRLNSCATGLPKTIRA